ncbi:CCR4-NOT transcription complex subunit 1 [Frankliniella occidentalis]|uniref:CCR4-NOT transcription complex subunit 1 n=1 Tax=Frankliniella occidentalis TaxID=133901 RepID=A0A6J1T010_FRAOC|nr:CCR4-NOT transcription complex subunit 1 [Frankliniella occidentalis]
MNLDSLSFALSQITYLVANLTKKNFKSSSQELSQLVGLYGVEADRHLLRCLLSHVDLSVDGSKSNNSLLLELLGQECSALLAKPSLVSNICYAVDNPLHHQKTLKPSPLLFTQLSKVLKLNPVQEVVFGLALTHSANPDTQNFATQFVNQKLTELIRSYIDLDSSRGHHEGGLHDSTPEVLHLILSSVFCDPGNQFGVTSETKESFLKNLRRDFPRELVPVVLAPLLFPNKPDLPMDKLNQDSTAMANSQQLADMIMEMGYNFTSSFEQCRNALGSLSLGGRDIPAGAVARILSMMARTHSGLDDQVSLQSLNSSNFWGGSESGVKDKGGGVNDPSHPTTWNIEVFIQTLKELVPNIVWNDVVTQLDHPDFIIKDRMGLNLLTSALLMGWQSQGSHHELFPVDFLYRRVWRNTEGQFSLLQQILKNPDIFCITDYPFHSAPVDVLKAPPESDNKEIATWRCVDLVETLLLLADRGLYAQVQELFNVPITLCPDVLVLVLLNISSPVTILRQELFKTLIPIFLSNHPNSAIILHNAWHSQMISIKPIIMHAMAEWYMRGDTDQTRLSRILDVAQDLKALTVLLNAQSFLFVIDLACLASRREYLKLEKWLADKIHDHGEPFVSACVKFLQRRCPQIMGGVIKDENMPKSAQLPHETLAVMLNCLQGCTGGLSQELTEVIMTMVANCSLLLNKPRQPPPGPVLRSHSQAHRSGLEHSLLGGQVFPSSQVSDPIASLSSSLVGLNLGGMPGGMGGVGGVGPPSSSAFNLPGSLGPLVSTPGSPSRLLAPSGPTGPGPSQSPFPMLLGNQLQHVGGPVGSQVPTGAATSLVGGMGMPHLGSQQVDKTRLGEISQMFPEMSPNVPKEIEDEANSYFQRIYNHPPHPTLSIDEVLEMLKKFKDSSSKREKEVYYCMIRNLFEEYRFFPQYPDKELHITAQLFGGIVDRELCPNYLAMGLALRSVLEALRKPHGSKMYYFGIAALDRFRGKLKDYHKYCEHVSAIPHFREFPPHLIEYVEFGKNSMEPPLQPSGPVLPASLAALVAPTQTPTTTAMSAIPVATKPTPSTGGMPSRPSIANATNIDTLLVATEKEDKITAPPEALQDKVAFVFNNLSQLNLGKKCEEIRDLVTEEYWAWIAQYLVMKRASIELNFHALYSNFLDTLNIPQVYTLVLRETYRNIRVLLRSDKGIANFSDRSLLKNLGHWLGMLTLGRSGPILHIDIDIKSLLAEAYNKGQQELLYVVPFVAKVLEACAKSKVFKPPCPWTMAIMNVLAELHQEPDLKLNLKFEIEVLCKNLNIDVADLKPSHYLKDPASVENMEYQLSQPKKKDQPGTTSVPSTPQTPGPHSGPSEESSHAVPTATVAPMSNSSSSSVVSHAAAVAAANHAAAAAAVAAATAGADLRAVSMLPPAPVPQPCTSPPPGLPAGPPEPRFSYSDINVSGITNIGRHIVINNNVALFQANPQLKPFVRPAVERAVQEWIAPVVDRSVKIALTTSEQIVKKDFALDPEESRMRIAAHHMVRNLTAGMAMITCRDQLLLSIGSNLKTAFSSHMIGATQQQKDMCEQAAQQTAQDNMEVACAFIQKTAIEKAIPEIDKHLMAEYERRKHARNEGRRYCDPVVLTYQAERMPEQIRLKVGGVTQQQMSVYEEFARNIPGFVPMTEREAALFVPKPFPNPLTVVPFQNTGPAQIAYGDESSAIYDKLVSELEHNMNSILTFVPTQLANLHSLMETLMIARRSPRDALAAMTLLQKTVESLLEGMSQLSQIINDPETMTRFRDTHLRILKGLQDQRMYGQQWTNKQVTRCLIESRGDLRYNPDAVDCLVRSGLVNMQQYDLHLAQAMENGLNFPVVAFAMHLVQLYLVDERLNTNITESDLGNTIEMLARIAQHSRSPPEGLTALIELLRTTHDPNFLVDRAPGGPTAHIHSGILQVTSRDFDDLGYVEKTDYLLREWVSLIHSPNGIREPTKAFGTFVQHLNVQGFLKTDDVITRFFRISTRLCVDMCCQALTEQSNSPTVVRTKCYTTLDAYVKLIALLVKHSGDTANSGTKINLLNKVLGIVAGVLLHDQDAHTIEFQQLPYQRMFIMLFLELNAPEPILETINFQVLTAFCHTLHILSPSKAPGFSYAWLEIVSHRVFLGRMLALTPQQKGWGMYSQLLMDLFKFLAPFLRNAELAKPVTLLYKGTLRLLLVLLHDFPEFLCDYHYGFCDVIPPNCIQMRNLILSAFPRNMRLPDPFTPNLKVDMLPEIAHAPRVLTNFSSMIQPPAFKKDLDSYLKARAPVTFLSELRGNLQISQEPGMAYNIPLMNALVLYVGTQAINYIRSKSHTPNMTTIAHSAHMDIFQNLAVDLDTEGRYLFLNAIANQLRYPNSHTHYFSCTLLYLFAEANSEAIQEQITRVLLERLIVNRPHPWGLLITFIELIKNPTYKFWLHEFVHCAPEIEKLFESVARSCMVQKQVQPVQENEVQE